MLLPFIENAFKHGPSQVMEHPWISLTLLVSNNELSMKMINGKPATTNGQLSGIGIANVRKRLELLYPGQHELVINDEEEMYIVNLKIALATGRVEATKTAHNGNNKELQLPHR